ncbi:MAG: cyclase family protein [Deltaproteobacteria bacterium]|nr:cyclase family protein [Deltaproteobacteria bacterium]
MGWKLIDLSHPWGMDTPPWVGYASPKIYYTQRLPYNHIVSQWIETSLHIGTHMDAPLHGVAGGCDMASIPLNQCFGEGVIVDISEDVSEWGFITPEMIMKRMDVKKGDILIYHTGWHRYYTYGSEPDEERYMCRHPGPGKREFADWICDMQFKWIGVDAGSGDHPMNTTIRKMRPDLAKEFEEKMGRPISQIFPDRDLFFMHRKPFAHRIPHIENIGGDIDQVLNRRCYIGAFPWRFVGGEASICRVAAFIEQ